ncbi:MAG: SDR family oxidoreductase [Rubellimicrobium sp.]|nr:SDR family oxidoreductase [Rubellimicrobium sp.]
MSGRTAVISGAAQGIGHATVKRLMREGFSRFLLIDRQSEALKARCAALAEAGAEATALVADLAGMDWRAPLAAALARIGPVDVLVNAAGTTARGGIEDTTQETFDLIFHLNVRAPFFLMQEVAQHMRAGGVIVNITSMLAYGGPPFLVPYSASKAALVALTKGAANTLKQRGLHVFAVNLGWTWTPGEQEVQTRVHGLAPDWAETIGARQPFGRLLMPEDPAGLIAFLVSPDARMMTGAVIDLDQYVAGTVEDNPGN